MNKSGPRHYPWADIAYWVLLTLVAGSVLFSHHQLGFKYPMPWPDEGSFLWQAISFQENNTLFATELNPDRPVFWMPPGYMVWSGFLFKITGFSFVFARFLSSAYVFGALMCLGGIVSRFPGRFAYIAFAGGIDTPPVLGSRSTFHMAGVGGVEGHALKAGQRIPLGDAAGTPGRRVKDACRPPIDDRNTWTIEVVPGPNDDWIDAAGQARFLDSDWTVLAKSNRTGYRLEGPAWTFSEIATNKRPEHGQDPSNILDHGYPLGAVNLAGQTPIILVNDGPSTGGFINPYTVPSAAFWKLAQTRPNDRYRFKTVNTDEAVALRDEIDRLCDPASLE